MCVCVCSISSALQDTVVEVPNVTWQYVGLLKAARRELKVVQCYRKLPIARETLERVIDTCTEKCVMIYLISTSHMIKADCLGRP